MIQKNFWLGILAMMLIFTMAVVGCDNGHNPSPSPSTGDSINGIWVSSDSVDPELFTLDNGNFEHFLGSSLTTKGTYTLDGNNISLTTTHVHGDMLNEVESFELIVEESFESKWYPAADIQPLLQALLQELQASWQNFQDLYGGYISEDEMQAINEMMQGYFDKMFSTQTFAYSVNGDTLTLTFDGEPTAFTRK